MLMTWNPVFLSLLDTVSSLPWLLYFLLAVLLGLQWVHSPIHSGWGRKRLAIPSSLEGRGVHGLSSHFSPVVSRWADLDVVCCHTYWSFLKVGRSTDLAAGRSKSGRLPALVMSLSLLSIFNCALIPPLLLQIPPFIIKSSKIIDDVLIMKRSRSSWYRHN